MKWCCQIAISLFYLILYSKIKIFGWNRLMCLFHIGIYLAWYLYLSKWFKYLGSIHCQPRLILAGKSSSSFWWHEQESKNVSNKVKPWCLHQALGLVKGSMMWHWTGHTAGKLTCQVKGHFEHQMMKFEFVRYLWHCDHCLFWAHKDEKREKCKKKTKIILYTANYSVKTIRENRM